jgi:hypothetical protein
MRHFRSEFQLPIKDTQGFACSERRYFPQGRPPVHIPLREIGRWLRIYLRGRRRVNVDVLKVHVQGLTENEWRAVVMERPVTHWRPGNKALPEVDLNTIPDPRADPWQTVYLRQLLEIVEGNLMSDEVPYFRALLDKTPAKALALVLNANPSTTSKRMNQVRAKVQSIITALNRRDSS